MFHQIDLFRDHNNLDQNIGLNYILYLDNHNSAQYSMNLMDMLKQLFQYSTWNKDLQMRYNNSLMIIDVVYDAHEHRQLYKYLILIFMAKRIKSSNLQVDETIKRNTITFNIAISPHDYGYICPIFEFLCIYIYTCTVILKFV